MVVNVIDEEQQAFPDGILNQDGMTLRDYFAAKATDDDVKEYQTGRKIKEVQRKDGLGNLRFSETVYYTREQAKYRYADAMLKEREQ
jgi:hypothetical protein